MNGPDNLKVTGFHDRFGRPIAIGDYLAVPTRRGSNCWLKVARVTGSTASTLQVLLEGPEYSRASHLKTTKQVLRIGPGVLPFGTLEQLVIPQE
jgi:hypothetical protein